MNVTYSAEFKTPSGESLLELYNQSFECEEGLPYLTAEIHSHAVAYYEENVNSLDEELSNEFTHSLDLSTFRIYTIEIDYPT